MNVQGRLTLVSLLALAGLWAAPAGAAGTVLSGTFDGSESRVGPLPGNDCAASSLGFQSNTFEVSADGSYYLFDGFFYQAYAGAPAVQPLVYANEFDPLDGSPDELPLGEVRADGTLNVDLVSGETYVLVVQHRCSAREGAWAVGFMGPGSVSSSRVAAVPGFTSGNFGPDAPTLRKPCGDNAENARYRQSGPVRVSRTGTYYFSGPPDDRLGLCLLVYSRPINASQPGANHVAGLHSGGTVELEAGRDYYFVVHRVNGHEAGDFLFVLAPAAPLRINAAMSDSWYNPDTPGQGFFLDVYEQRNEIFLGWFTFAPESATGVAVPHRWMTAFGPFSGPQAQLAIEWTEREDNNRVTQYTDGTLELEFIDCSSGWVSYSLGGDEAGAVPVSGVIPIRRIANDSVDRCRSLYAGPAMPGPL